MEAASDGKSDSCSGGGRDGCLALSLLVVVACGWAVLAPGFPMPEGRTSAKLIVFKVGFRVLGFG